MDEKMTSGEIAKKAGVSQKAVRLYDEKILDLGCGYSKLWRSNWERIPEGTKLAFLMIQWMLAI